MRTITTNQAWQNIFDRYKILQEIAQNKYFDISADQIKDVDGKEARLMTKIDFREHLPEIMKNEKLSILAIENGLYRIAKNNPFIDVAMSPANTRLIAPPKHISSIDPYNVKSESAALDIGFVAGMQNQVFGEQSDLVIRGRLRGDLSFVIGDVQYKVDGVQLEVDSGYESQISLHLVEAKLGYRNNINIRQLLYPQIYWERQMASRKKVKSYVFFLQDGIYRFIPYVYQGRDLGFLDHGGEISFQFDDTIKNPSEKEFSIYDIQIDWTDSQIDTSVPFPQADEMEKINAMFVLIYSNSDGITRQGLFENFDLVERQIDYYCNALKWLKLCDEKPNGLLSLTMIGNKIAKLSFRNRMEEIAKIIFSNKITNSILNRKDLKEEWFREYRMASDSTIHRRTLTINAWVNYFKKVFGIKD